MILTEPKVERDIKAVFPGCRIIQRYSKFYDSELYWCKSSTLIVCLTLFAEFLQRMSLVSLDLPENVSISTYHKGLQKIVVPLFMMTDYLNNGLEYMLELITAYLFIKNVVFVGLFIAQQKLTARHNEALKICYALNFIDIQLLAIPLMTLFFDRIMNGNILELAMAFSCVFFIVFEFVLDLNICHDFGYFKTSKLQPRVQTSDIYRFTGLMFIMVMMSLFEERTPTVKIIANILNIFLGLLILFDLHSNMQFIQEEAISISLIIINIIYISESTVGLAFLSFKDLNTQLDLDYMLCILILPSVNLVVKAFRNKEEKLLQLFIYKIRDQIISDQYLELLALKMNIMKDEDRITLISAWKFHFESCADLRCLCFLLRFYYQEPTEKTIEEMMINHASTKVDIKAILYDNRTFMQQLIVEHQSTFKIDSDANIDILHEMSLVNLQSVDGATVIGSLYSNQVANIEDDVFMLFCSYQSYLLNVLDNHVGALIQLYSYIFSKIFKQHRSLIRVVYLQNMIRCSVKQIKKKFNDSQQWLATEVFHKAYDYSSALDSIEEKMKALSKLKYEFFEGFADQSISFGTLLRMSSQIFKERNSILTSFNKIKRFESKSSRYLCQFINFNRKLLFVEKGSLIKQYEKLFSKIKSELVDRNFLKLGLTDANIDLYRTENIVLFASPSRSSFFISKSTSNGPSFFGYSAQEFKNKPLSSLLPPAISLDHDSYVLRYINQSKRDIATSVYLKGFAQEKNGTFRIVTAIVKIEYLLGDDIFVCGMLIPENEQNNKCILLERNGTVISINQQFEDAIGKESRIEAGSLLFMGMPTLFPFFLGALQIEDKEVIAKQKSLAHEIDTDDIKHLTNNDNFKQLNPANHSNYEMNTYVFTSFLYIFILKNPKIVQFLKDKLVTKEFEQLTRLGSQSSNIQVLQNTFSTLIAELIDKFREFYVQEMAHIQEAEVYVDKYRFKSTGIELYLFTLKDCVTPSSFTIEFMRSLMSNNLQEEMFLIAIAPATLESICNIATNLKRTTS